MATIKDNGLRQWHFITTALDGLLNILQSILIIPLSFSPAAIFVALLNLLVLLILSTLYLHRFAMLSSESHGATSNMPSSRDGSSDEGTDSLVSMTGFISPRRETLNSAQTSTNTPKRTQTQKDSGFLAPQAGATKTSWDETEWLSSPPSPRSAKRSTRTFAHGEDSDKDEPTNDTPVKLSRRRTKKPQSFGSSTDTVQPSKPTRKSSAALSRYTTPVSDRQAKLDRLPKCALALRTSVSRKLQRVLANSGIDCRSWSG
jgi:hypothetical protein